MYSSSRARSAVPFQGQHSGNFDNWQHHETSSQQQEQSNQGTTKDSGRNPKYNYRPPRPRPSRCEYDTKNKPLSTYPPRLYHYSHNPYSPSHRSFEDLTAERSYLLNSLQHEDQRATNLLKSLAYCQDTFVSSKNQKHAGLDHPNIGLDHMDAGEARPPGYVGRRKVRKQMAWVRRQLAETTEQEKRILERLGQVTFEIQWKERWGRVEWELDWESDGRAWARRYGMGSDGTEQEGMGMGIGMEGLRLDARSPEFTPMGFWVAQATLDASVTPYVPSAQEPPGTPRTAGKAAIAVDAAALPPDNTFMAQLDCITTVTAAAAVAGAGAVIQHYRSSSTTDLSSEEEQLSAKYQEKRLSMPEIRATWDNNGCEVQYVGYYISGQ
jgi:hypothetical protein